MSDLAAGDATASSPGNSTTATAPARQTTRLDTSALWQLLYMAALGILALGVILWALAQWNEGGAGDAADAATATVTLALTEEPPQLDSTRSTDQVSIRLLGHVMEGLLRYDEHNQIVGGVAERWNIGEREATFWLRPDAHWSNGEPVTAHDFVFAWRKALEPATASQYAFILYAIEGAEAINRVPKKPDAKVADDHAVEDAETRDVPPSEKPDAALDDQTIDGVEARGAPPETLGAEALDDRTLRVTLARPIPYFDKLTAFSTYLPINEAFYEATDGRYGADADEMLYNGPFVVASWVHGASIRLEKNLDYWDAERIRLNAIDHAYITTDMNAVLNLYKDGKVALAGLNAENLDDALQQRWQINRFASGSVYFLEINHRPERLTSNYHLRKALQAVNDPAELVNKIIKLPGNLPGKSLFPVWLEGVDGYFRQEYPAPEHHPDLARARAHFAQALDELGLEELPPLVMLTGDNPAANKQAEYYQNVFKETLGIDIKIDRQIFKQRLDKMTRGEFDLVLAGWGPDYADPMTFADLFASWNENNRGRYVNPELDAAVDTARSSRDPKTRMDAFAEVQRIIYDDAVVLVQYESGSVYVAHPRVKGVVRRAVGTDPDYTNAWIEPIGAGGAG